MTLQEIFGRRLKEIRISKKLTQKELADLTGLSVSFISNLERGVNAPSFVVLEVLAEKLEIPVAEFFLFQ
jgi:transcriptional regulator with XRE-family HTH domain